MAEGGMVVGKGGKIQQWEEWQWGGGRHNKVAIRQRMGRLGLGCGGSVGLQILTRPNAAVHVHADL